MRNSKVPLLSSASLNPSLTLDLTSSLDSRITFTRSSTATYFNSAGTLTASAADQPRFDFTPAFQDGLQGLLIEGATTNFVTNPRCEGGGATPTGWGGPFADAGITVTAAGSGTDSGFTYSDLRFQGTSGGIGFVSQAMSVTGTIAALTGQTWTNSVYVKLVAGSWTNCSNIWISVDERTAADARTILNNQAGQPLPLAGTSLASNRLVYTLALSGGATTASYNIAWRIGVSVGVAVDFTLRVAGPQAEQLPAATSLMLPPVGVPGASTRAAENITMPTTGGWYNPSASTFAVDMTLEGTGLSGTALEIDDGTLSNRMTQWFPTTTAQAIEVVATTPTVTSTFGNFVAATAFKTAQSFKDGAQAGSFNGAAPVATTAAGHPIVSQIRIGSISNGGGSNYLFGWIRKIRYWPRVLTTADLQRASSFAITDANPINYDLTSLPLPSAITFTRASTGTYVDSTNTVQTAAINTPRINCDSTTARTNWVRNSVMAGSSAPSTFPTNYGFIFQDASSTWTVVGSGTEYGMNYLDMRWRSSNATSTAVTRYVPEGTNVISALPGQVWTASYYIRVVAGSMDNLTCVVEAQGRTSGGARRDIADTNFVPTDALRRVSATTTLTATTAYVCAEFQIGVTLNAAYDVTLRIYGWQIEQSATATAYIATSGTAASSAAPLGLLMEQAKTNLMINSAAVQSFSNTGFTSVTANNVTAPDGTLTATRFVQPAVSGASFSVFYQSAGTLTVAAYSASIWLKGAVGGEVVYLMALKDTALYYKTTCTLTTSWVRYTLTTSALTVNTWNLQVGVDLRDAGQSAQPAVTYYAWGAQMELGNPTSYIPTVGATVTRSMDNASVTNTGWYNPIEGALAVEYMPNETPDDYYSPLVLTGTAFDADYLIVGGYAATTTQVNPGGFAIGAVTNSPTIIGYTALTATNAVVHRIAYSWGVGAVSTWGADGNAWSSVATTASAAVIPVITTLGIAGHHHFQDLRGCHIRRVRYWSRNLSLADVQAAVTA